MNNYLLLWPMPKWCEQRRGGKALRAALVVRLRQSSVEAGVNMVSVCINYLTINAKRSFDQ